MDAVKDVSGFFKSPIAEKTVVTPRVILHRDKWTREELENLKSDIGLKVEDIKNDFDLEMGGVVVAKGKIIIKNKKNIFKITEVFSNN